MDLFVPIVDKSRWNQNFALVLDSRRAAERILFLQWAEGFVDRDGKFVKEFQTTFNSSFWEIYLYATFRAYGFEIDWTRQSPDFSLRNGGYEFIIEATTANAAQGRPNEWDRTFSPEELMALRRFKSLNTEAIIRLSNSIYAKHQKYEQAYRQHNHVYGKPFVLAVAPFEQPHFNLQYDRPIRALLYDDYVDEDVYLDNPSAFPAGPPSVQLGRVHKSNGAPVELGLFNSPAMSSVSAVLFSCAATWGKLSAMCNNPDMDVQISSSWGTPPHGYPQERHVKQADHTETIQDGLQIFHNPHADIPLDPAIFRYPRVVQHYYDLNAEEWVYEGQTNSLHFRQVTLWPRGIL